MSKELPSKTTVINQHFSPTFGRYEGLRILIPGVYFALLLALYYRAFLIQFAPQPMPFVIVGVFLVAVIVAGFSIYAKETPKRRRAFQENQPSQYLSARARMMKDMPLLEDAEARRLYFFILNNYIPPVFHEKIFFFGMVYSVMIQIRRSSFWFGLVSLASLLVEFSRGSSVSESQGLLVYTILIWIVYLLNIRYNKADRKMQENYQDQIFWMEMNSSLIDSVLRRRQSVPPLQ